MAGIVLVGMFLGLSIAVGRAQEHTLKRIEGSSIQVKRWGGWTLIAVGMWFLILAVWADFFAEIFPV